MTMRWPFFDLVLRTPRLELRLPTDDLAFELAELAIQPIHSPDTMPFAVPWTAQPAEERARGALQWLWRTRAELSVADWRLNFVALLDGVVIGAQDLHAAALLSRREVQTGSWLTQSQQGQGYGKEMRAAVLALSFDYLGARWATSESLTSNVSSASVSRALGYAHDGFEVASYLGVEQIRDRWRMSSSQWEQRALRISVAVDGLSPCLSMLGLDPGGRTTVSP